ncbi:MULTISPECIES: hypothetical protein [unclassified Bradyrhizobium]
MMVDGAGYDIDGRILYVGQKAYALPTLHAAVSTLGLGLAGLLVPIELANRFVSFDDMIDGIEAAAPEIYEKTLIYAAPVKDATVNIIGWSTRENGPTAYVLRMNEAARDEEIATRDAAHRREFGQNAFVDSTAFKLERTDFSTINPPPFRPMSEIGFPSFDLSEDIGDQADVELDLLHILEAQRRRKFATRPGSVEAHKIGGLALLTSVTGAGVFQKVVHRWVDDRIGGLIEPDQINDWTAWRKKAARKLRKGNP